MNPTNEVPLERMIKPSVREARLYEASLSGSVADLEILVAEDPLILDRASLTCFDQTPLHIAAWRGHSDFTRALLSRKLGLATERNSDRRLPLHLASAEGHHEIVQQLLDANDDVCKDDDEDEDGRTPLHLAAMKGRVEVIKRLTQARPESIRKKLGRGETVLHLCVKYNRLEALKTLVKELGNQNDAGFVNSEDQDGNTILHLAAALKQLDTIKYLLKLSSVKEQAKNQNKNGCTDFGHCGAVTYQRLKNHGNLRVSCTSWCSKSKKSSISEKS
ncbi:Ankyrin repeat-containing protein BDA1 [Camellia lanceoleosa]|uniref:Ankyrin repeat-containing protein BDA1 n=1 Tax=Camellia lanceoleosa TaxID=1840588 RepID=A0ACC0FBM0_9ERIC|nr:Ankyrin repeat-containing protein BDA1 [Camellia lanceoleosa]